jgi:hypothetical protein
MNRLWSRGRANKAYPNGIGLQVLSRQGLSQTTIALRKLLKDCSFSRAFTSQELLLSNDVSPLIR